MTDVTALRASRPAAHRDTGHLLRASLLLDGVASAAMGLGLAAGSQALDRLLGIPAGWLLGLGIFLLAYGAGVFAAGRASVPPARIVRVIVVGNLTWVAASVLAVFLGAFDLTGWGVAVVLGQAALVAVLAALQSAGLRRP